MVKVCQIIKWSVKRIASKYQTESNNFNHKETFSAHKRLMSSPTLAGTPRLYQGSGSGPPSCTTPRQPTLYADPTLPFIRAFRNQKELPKCILWQFSE